ncbi:MAG: dsRBD fold-containing protein [Mycolicibacterium sp.]|uniref:dsRBD fold-containing protein n=1 Tax=Mycolicibacterium sp. TaxID=2320850 RepID=UPI003D12E8A6
MNNEHSDHVLKNLTVDVSIDEHRGLSRAKARLRWCDRESLGFGAARLSPVNKNIAEIGNALAVARALSDLGRRIQAEAGHEIEAVAHDPALFLY